MSKSSCLVMSSWAGHAYKISQNHNAGLLITFEMGVHPPLMDLKDPPNKRAYCLRDRRILGQIYWPLNYAHGFAPEPSRSWKLLRHEKTENSLASLFPTCNSKKVIILKDEFILGKKHEHAAYHLMHEYIYYKSISTEDGCRRDPQSSTFWAACLGPKCSQNIGN